MNHRVLHFLSVFKRHAVQPVVLGAALCAAGWAGAQWQAHAQPALAAQAAIDTAAQRLDRDTTRIDDSLAGLSARLGELQARLIAMEAVRQRVTTAAGLPAAGWSPPDDDAPAAPAVMDDIGADAPAPEPAGSATALGRRIDALRERVAAQEDAYALIDLAMSSQAGVAASLPTYSPVDYPYLSSSFGWRRNPLSLRRSRHEGLDFVAPRGAPIYAASGGVVRRAGTLRGYGKMVEIDHGGGLITRYAHASALQVERGDIVRQGQQIARVGSTGRSTGPHLHFEVRLDGRALDPSHFLGASVAAVDAQLAHAD